MVYLYEKKLPEINELVVVNVTEINDLNVITKLIDYDDLPGYLSFGELSKKKRANINTIVSVGKNKIAIVTNINLDKNYVELSLRNMSPDDIEKFNLQHKKYTNLYNLWRWIYIKLVNTEKIIDSNSINEIDNNELTKFMENTLWIIVKNTDIDTPDENIILENILEILLDKETNMEILSLIKNQDIDKIKNILDEYISIKTHVVKPEKYSEINLTSYEINGLSDIKKSLDYKSFSFYKDIEQDYDISITYLSDSVYRISINQLDVILQNSSYTIDKVYTLLTSEIKSRSLSSKIIIKI
jgi:translation initiation factor 2 alpha subunit (eIF-2alpha)